MPNLESRNQSEHRLAQLLDPAYPLSRSDVIRVLEWIKKKVADSDSSLLDLPKPQVLKYFAQAM